MPSFNTFIHYAVMRECTVIMDHYHSLMHDAHDASVKKVYAIMAGRKNRILRKLSKLGNEAPQTDLHATAFTECIVLPIGAHETFDPMATALLTARFIEFESYSRYIDFAHRSRDEGRKRFFLYMVNLHKKELLFLEKLLRHTGEFSLQYV